MPGLHSGPQNTMAKETRKGRKLRKNRMSVKIHCPHTPEPGVTCCGRDVMLKRDRGDMTQVGHVTRLKRIKELDMVRRGCIGLILLADEGRDVTVRMCLGRSGRDRNHCYRGRYDRGCCHCKNWCGVPASRKYRCYNRSLCFRNVPCLSENVHPELASARFLACGTCRCRTTPEIFCLRGASFCCRCLRKKAPSLSPCLQNAQVSRKVP